ncbi:MAG: protein jag [Endomicrobium sp.]|jgi:spoIIIJ-associated protein|nr:protein jag [Endomicrobium sp.]MDR2818832.1 protein jag [Endomicrobium sp.]
MLEIEVKGRNVKDAIDAGLVKLGCNKEDVSIRIVNEGSTGLFGLMGAKPAVVLISVKKSKCNIKTTTIDTEVDQNKVCKKAEFFLSGLLNKMNVKFSSIETSFKDDLININVSTNDCPFIIGKNGQTLDALEYLTQIIVNKELNSKLKVNLDCENYRRKQKDKLKILIDKAVDYVNRTGKIYHFEPMSAKERKIIHLYLKDNHFVESFSEGTGILRKVGLKSTKSAPTI